MKKEETGQTGNIEIKDFDRVEAPSPKPYFAVGIFCLLYAVFFPLYLWWHYIIPVILGVLIFKLFKKFCKPRFITVEIPPKEMTEDERYRRESEEYLKKLRSADIAIEDEEVSQKIRSLEKLTEEIFRITTEKPEKKPQVRRFTQYYLPTLVKLLSSYDRLENANNAGENINESKKKINGLLDVAVKAFTNEIDSLFADDKMDISSDITVFKTLLKQQGLLDEETENERDDTNE